MSEQATTKTQELLTVGLKTVLERPTSDGRWDAAIEYGQKAKELSKAGLTDEDAIREMARENAEELELDPDVAEKVINFEQRQAGGSLHVMHGPTRKVWKGNGANIATVDSRVVSYFSRPGLVEIKYGDSFQYITPQLFWAGALALDGFEAIDNTGGYQKLKQQLQLSGQLKPGVQPHLGSVIQIGEPILKDEGLRRSLYLSSASGTLPDTWVNDEFQRIVEYAQRATEDENAGLLDGFALNLRAGLYDTMFGHMVLDTLRGKNLNGATLEIPHPARYVGVDIN